MPKIKIFSLSIKIRTQLLIMKLKSSKANTTIGDDEYVRGEKIIFKGNILKVIGYMFFVVGVIELVLSIFNKGDYWLATLQHLSIGIAGLMDSYKGEKKIVYCLQFCLSIVCLLCIIVERTR